MQEPRSENWKQDVGMGFANNLRSSAWRTVLFQLFGFYFTSTARHKACQTAPRMIHDGRVQTEVSMWIRFKSCRNLHDRRGYATSSHCLLTGASTLEIRTCLKPKRALLRGALCPWTIRDHSTATCKKLHRHSTATAWGHPLFYHGRMNSW